MKKLFLLFLALWVISCSGGPDDPECYHCTDTQSITESGVTTVLNEYKYDTCMSRNDIETWQEEGTYNSGNYTYKSVCIPE